MAAQISSWWRETGKLYARYMVAVAASIPVAAAYVYLGNHNLGSTWDTAGLLGVGIGMASLGWRLSARLFRKQISYQRIKSSQPLYWHAEYLHFQTGRTTCQGLNDKSSPVGNLHHGSSIHPLLNEMPVPRNMRHHATANY